MNVAERTFGRAAPVERRNRPAPQALDHKDMIKVGIAKRLDIEGKEHPWRIVIDRGGRRYQMLVALPEDRLYISEPVDPVFGDLLAGEKAETARNTLLQIMGPATVLVHESNKGSNLLEGLKCVFMGGSINDNVDQAIDEIECLERKFV